MRLSQTLGNTVPSRSAISKSRTVAGSLGRAAIVRACPKHARLIQVREHTGHSIRCSVSASSMFSTRRALCGRELSS
ncbi:hypothetical protein TNCV_4056421 [Trichonephila clavipes]|nr:hypothetical protein TNCV_4056421 [Trichonephila clavipes]